MERERKHHASRSCNLLPDGRAAWSKPSLSECESDATAVAGATAHHVSTLTAVPSHISPLQVHAAVEKLDSLVQYAARDEKVSKYNC